MPGCCGSDGRDGACILRGSGRGPRGEASGLKPACREATGKGGPSRAGGECEVLPTCSRTPRERTDAGGKWTGPAPAGPLKLQEDPG